MDAPLSPLRQSARLAWSALTQGWRDLRHRAGEALTRFTRNGPDGGEQVAHWGLVSTDMRVEDDRIVVHMELPGMSRESLRIDIDRDRLSVSGDKRMAHEQADGRYQLVQCVYGRFCRELRLPHEVDAQHCKARYHDGVLHIEMPRLRSGRGRRIPVHAG